MEQYFTELPFWEKLKETEKDIMRSSAFIRRYGKGESIHSCNRKCLGMVYVISGKIRLYLLAEDGRSITLFYAGPGESCVFAASCIISQITFPSELMAAEETELLVIPAVIFSRLIKENIYLRCYMYELSARSYSQAIWVMQKTMFSRLDRRVAEYLVSEHERSGSFSLSLTQQQIASDIFSAREAVARMMKHFSDDGLITSYRGKIVINDIEGLKKLLS